MAKAKAQKNDAVPGTGGGKSLVIVESPAKAKTINKILGRDFIVKASMGHVRDIPKKEFGIILKDRSGNTIEGVDDIRRGKKDKKAAAAAAAEKPAKGAKAKAEKKAAKTTTRKVPAAEITFEPVYAVLPEKKKSVDELKKAAAEADMVYLACDFDREGEAIAWHVASLLKIPESKARRVVFNEITETAIKKAFEHPERISMDRVNAQQARRVLDRLVGYQLSPLLWKKVLTGLSAGRVQSVAVRLIAEREKEIQAFKPEEYWRIVAAVEAAGKENGRFDAELKKWAGETVKMPDEAAARAVETELKTATDWRVVSVAHEDKVDAPDAPYRTATLQQQASIRLRFTSKKTMSLAQQLYEGVELGAEGSVGLITYMRTDSLNVAEEAIVECRDFIQAAPGLGAGYLPEKARRFKTEAKGAQEAHEAIRPTSAHRTPDSIAGYLAPDQLKLYRLIWERFIASQMKAAIYAVTTVEVAAGRGLFRASGKVLKFDGHAKISGVKIKDDEAMLPAVIEGETVALGELKTTQHFTQPPPRYTEATLVKMLEKLGIGRPSTYAQIITTIQTRGYVKREARKFYCTDIGMVVTDKLVKHFADIMETSFTSRMETELDEVEDAKRDWQDVLREFYGMFEADLERAKTEMKHVNQDAPESPFKCEKCNRPLLYKINKYGKYLACSGYPECSNVVGIDEEGKPKPKVEAEETEHVCEKCGSPMVIKTGRRGRFLACSAYPKCKNTKDLDADGNIAAARRVDTEIQCDRCHKNNMVVRMGRRGPFLGCGGYPKCRNTRDLTPDEMKSMNLPAHFTAAVAADAGAAAGASAGAGAGGEAGPDVKCDECGKPMVKKFGRRGPFLACTGYPDCKKTKPMTGVPREAPKPSGEMCDKCGLPMLIRMSRRGPFQGCSGYPGCKNAKPLPAGVGAAGGPGGPAKEPDGDEA